MLIKTDDSGSMRFDGGERIKDMRLIISRVISAALLFDDDGISIRFMNWEPGNRITKEKLDHIENEQQIDLIVDKVLFNGTTPMGQQMKERIIDPLILEPARVGRLKKPVLVITVTDGQPTDNPKIFDTIRYASSEISRMPQYGKGAISFQFAQVGDDPTAMAFLSKLDNDPQIGSLVDCTSSKSTLIMKSESRNSSSILKRVGI